MEREDASQGTERGDSSQRHDPEGDRQRRLEALRGLADHSGGPAGAPATKTAANPRSRRWIALTALLVVALLAGGLVTHLRAPSAPTRQTSAPPPPTLLRINPGLDGYICPTHLAWSPDGARVAVLASRSGTCDNTHVAGPHL